MKIRITTPRDERAVAHDYGTTVLDTETGELRELGIIDIQDEIMGLDGLDITNAKARIGALQDLADQANFNGPVRLDMGYDYDDFLPKLTGVWISRPGDVNYPETFTPMLDKLYPVREWTKVDEPQGVVGTDVVQVDGWTGHFMMDHFFRANIRRDLTSKTVHEVKDFFRMTFIARRELEHFDGATAVRFGTTEDGATAVRFGTTEDGTLAVAQVFTASSLDPDYYTAPIPAEKTKSDSRLWIDESLNGWTQRHRHFYAEHPPTANLESLGWA